MIFQKKHRHPNKDDGTRAALVPYPTMSLAEIEALPIPASADCLLWLWTTNAFMHEAYHVLAAWGFEPKTILTWVKDRFGAGTWLRGQTEHCILAVKGRPMVTLTTQTTVLHGKRRKHSEKPEDFSHWWKASPRRAGGWPCLLISPVPAGSVTDEPQGRGSVCRPECPSILAGDVCLVLGAAPLS